MPEFPAAAGTDETLVLAVWLLAMLLGILEVLLVAVPVAWLGPILGG